MSPNKTEPIPALNYNINNVVQPFYNSITSTNKDKLQLLIQKFTSNKLRKNEYDELISIWSKVIKVPLLEHYFKSQKAKKYSDENQVMHTTIFLTNNLLSISVKEVKQWFANECMSNYNWLESNTDNNSVKDSIITGKNFCALVGEISPLPMDNIKQLTNILSRNTSNLYAEYCLGIASMMTSQWGKAIPRFERIIDKEPNNEEVLYYLGNAYELVSQPKKALQTFEKLKLLSSNKKLLPEINERIKKLKNKT